MRQERSAERLGDHNVARHKTLSLMISLAMSRMSISASDLPIW